LNTNPTSPGVVVGVDATAQSGHAATWAAREAADRGTALTVVHALDLPRSADLQLSALGLLARRREEGAALLDLAAARLSSAYPELHINTILSEQGPASALTALSPDAELIVTGTNGRSGLAMLLFGSLGGELGARTYCPVVTVWGTRPDAASPEVVLGLEPDEDPAPIDFAFRTAARLGLGLRAVRAFQQPAAARDGDRADGVEAGREQALSDLGRQLFQIRERYSAVPVAIEAERGDPATVLHTAARDARLLVVGAHRRRGGLASRLGGVVHDLLERPGTPVAVVPLR
jgi:nucleotide-binding universal stress UspA family protein